MAKIGLLTSLLVMVFAMMERTALLFSVGISLFLLSTIKEFMPRAIKTRLSTIIGLWRVAQLEKYRKQHQQDLMRADEWLQRFALRTKTLLQSNFRQSYDGKIHAEQMISESEEGEKIFAEFQEWLSCKGIHLSEAYLRMAVNYHILRRRADNLRASLLSFCENTPSLELLLRIYAEEEMSIESTSNQKEYWNRDTLLYLIEHDFDKAALHEIFPKWPKELKEELAAVLSFLQEEAKQQIRFRQMEEWLCQSPPEKAITLSHFDLNADQLSEFRKELVYLMEMIGYKVSLPKEEKAGIDLRLERMGVKYGAILKPLSENQDVTTHVIHEVHTLRTLAELPNIMIITNRGFTPSALELAGKLGIICIHRDHLAEWMSRSVNPYQQQIGSYMA